MAEVEKKTDEEMVEQATLSSEWTAEDEALYQMVLRAGANPGEGGTK